MMNDNNTNNNLFLMIEHTPVHSNYGRLDELKTPLAITKKYPLFNEQVIDLEDFKIEILDINSNDVNLKIFDNKGVYSLENDFDFNIEYQQEQSIGTIKVNEQLQLSKYLLDASESWTIKLLK